MTTTTRTIEYKGKYLASGTVPDGYFGDSRNAVFSLIGNCVFVNCDCGSFRAPLGDVLDVAEALWRLRRDPKVSNYTLVK